MNDSIGLDIHVYTDVMPIMNFKYRFTEETIDKVYEWILSEVEKHDYLMPDVVFVDSTHIKQMLICIKQRKRRSRGL